jgi:hypothetical protein
MNMQRQVTPSIDGALVTCSDPAQECSDHRHGERRRQKSEGYAYMTMVGWIDRREKTRRKDEGVDIWKSVTCST